MKDLKSKSRDERIRLMVRFLEDQLDSQDFKVVYLPIVSPVDTFDRLAQLSNLRLFEVRNSKDKLYGHLRPEGTLLLLNRLDSNLKIVKNYYGGPMFRLEREGLYRTREFYQFGCEISAKKTRHCKEIKTLEAFIKLLRKLGLDFILEVNCLGQKGLAERLMDSKIRYQIDVVGRFLGTDIWKHSDLDSRKDYLLYLRELRLRKISYRGNLNLVRGLHYYNNLVFEIKVKGVAVVGGGRYDGLGGNLISSKSNYKHFGWGLGLSRLVKILELEA